jgi:hypothetical protein
VRKSPALALIGGTEAISLTRAVDSSASFPLQAFLTRDRQPRYHARRNAVACREPRLAMATRRERPALAALGLLLAMCALAPAAAQPAPMGASGSHAFSGTPRRTQPLASVPGCGGEAGGDVLVGGLDTSCVLDGALGPKET